MPPADPTPDIVVEFITGRLADVEAAFATAVEESKRADPLAPLTVLVGHVLLKRYLPRMLAQRGVAHINVRFASASELARDLADPAFSERTRASVAANRLMVRGIAESASGPYFGAISRGEGFVDALGRLFRELEMGGFDDTTALDQALAGTDANANTEKLRELAQMYREYLGARAAAGLTGLGDAYAAADASCLEGDLFIYGLWDPPELQLRLIERLAAGRRVRVFTASALAPDDPLAALRARIGGEIRELEPGAEDAIATVASRLFSSGGQRPAVQTDRIGLLSTPDTVREVWEAARACQQWAREGIGFHEMAVVYRNRDPYRALISEIFAEAGVDAYIHDGRPLSEHPLGRRLIALLELAASDDFSRRDVMEFIVETDLPFATRRNAAYGHVSPAAWDALTREAGIVAGIDQWRARLARVAGQRREEARGEGMEWKAEGAERIEGLLRFIDDFHAALTARADEATWDEHLAYVRTLTDAYAGGLNEILDALKDLRGLTVVAPRVRFAEFCAAVRDDLEGRDVSHVLGEPARLFGRQGVAVLDATSLRHLRFRAVCLVGVAERAWPPPQRPDPLLLEHERVRLNAAGTGVIPLRTLPDRDPAAFGLAVEAARERLVVSFARADAGSSGKHVASYFFREVAEALAGRSLPTDHLDESPVMRRIGAGRLACTDVDDAVTVAEYDRGLVRDEIAGERGGVTASLAAVTPAFGRAFVARDNRWSRTYTPYDGVMTDADAIARAAALAFGRERPVSPSRLEMYATCPYRYFLRYALRVDPVEEPESVERISALDRGSMIHAILEAFLTRIGRDDPPRASERERHIALLLEVAREEGARREAAGVTGRPLLWQMDQRAIHHDLIRWYDAEVSAGEESPLLPGAFEVGFGGARAGYGEHESPLTTAKTLVLDVDGRAIQLQGRIDRLDWDDARTRFRVIDYKTGSKGTKRRFAGGRHMQLPVYLYAAAGILDMPPTAGEAQYFYVSTKGGFSRAGLDGWSLNAADGEFRAILVTIAGGIDGGYFAPNPGAKKDHCTYCDYKDVCDRAIDGIMAHKAGDARADAYIRMTEIE